MQLCLQIFSVEFCTYILVEAQNLSGELRSDIELVTMVTRPADARCWEGRDGFREEGVYDPKTMIE